MRDRFSLISIGEKVKRYEWCLNKGLNESGNKMDIPVVEILADTGLLTYFVDSNLAGKGGLFVLIIMNCYALSLMWSKYQELKKAFPNNPL